ncbi:MAG TPA: putative sulfate exporter family transporter, partial [Pseudomonas sp.]|nr:putative sulfate exporter family transporter [Pseudomonas sp.]
MSAIALTRIHSRTRELAPGVIVSLIVAAAASFLCEHYGAPVMLFALLLGMALNFLSGEGSCKAGIEFTARSVLRIGVALLGMRITLEQIVGLGWKPLALVVILVVVTISVSVVAAKVLGFSRLFGMLTGGATAICGASAALALAAALPNHPQKERATLFTVIGVSALSTTAMILYPMICKWLELSPQIAGVFLGGTIHDVAQ